MRSSKLKYLSKNFQYLLLSGCIFKSYPHTQTVCFVKTTIEIDTIYFGTIHQVLISIIQHTDHEWSLLITTIVLRYTPISYRVILLLSRVRQVLLNGSWSCLQFSMIKKYFFAVIHGSSNFVGHGVNTDTLTHTQKNNAFICTDQQSVRNRNPLTQVQCSDTSGYMCLTTTLGLLYVGSCLYPVCNGIIDIL